MQFDSRGRVRISVVSQPRMKMGESIRVVVPGRSYRVCRVNVPKGVSPGQRFNVDLPSLPSEEMEPAVVGEDGWWQQTELVVALLS